MSARLDLIVVGAGLFGSVAAALARRRGLKVEVIDARFPLAASRCAACLFKPSWLGSLTVEERREAYAVLDELYGLETVRLRSGVPGVTLDLDWVPPHRVLQPPDRVAAVRSAHQRAVILASGEAVNATAVLVATGVWGRELVPAMPEARRLAGVAVYGDGEVTPSFNVWAPYKQAIAFNLRPNRAWFGDGSAILHRNWTPEREAATVRRAKAALGRVPVSEVRLGLRPYVEGRKGGYLEQHDGVWVSNGGAKNGTPLAALQALHLMRELGV